MAEEYVPNFEKLNQDIAAKSIKKVKPEIEAPKAQKHKTAENDPMGGWHTVIWSKGTIPGVSCYVRDQILESLGAKINDPLQCKPVYVGNGETHTKYRKFKQYE